MQDLLQPPFSEIVHGTDPLVSFIIPSYNKAAFLPESVGSALSQTYKNIEIVIVNDGSTDSTAEVSAQLRAQNPGARFTLIDKPNGGISDARNFAIERAAGRIVCCLDGDDIAAPSFIEKGISAMRLHGANLVCCNVELFGAESGEWVPQPYEQYGLRYNNCIPTLVMYDKGLWAKSGGYSTSFPFNEDWEFFLRLSRHGLIVHRINEKLFRYRVTVEGLAHNYIKDSWNQSVSLMITSNDDLYPVEQVLLAHKHLSEMRASWAARFEKQALQYPGAWLLQFWMGLAKEGKGDLQGALEQYIKANQLAGGNNWQSIYRIASLAGDANPQTAQLLHGVRILRPDMNRYVEEKLRGK